MWMLESVRGIRGHVNKQLTNHSSATVREIVEEYRWFLLAIKLFNSSKVGQLAISDRQLDFVACLTWA